MVRVTLGCESSCGGVSCSYDGRVGHDCGDDDDACVGDGSGFGVDVCGESCVGDDGCFGDDRS